ncbi:Flp pilus assembly protein CpaB [Gordonibacter sp. An230]|uniref:Flp pilus assembly protein CpaB n=1 Tax=Gordonibacter sp. An230 TaxID=1965592 RepID=UPI000B39E6B7|nr:Flp pilus assembly protein CpaB [Gordonibacter sp. An230]OUO92166.1 Flp pilus assembly protein CpaB [Gordonibacter sp. An230]
MKRRTTTVAGVVCGAVCAVCVLAYTQGVRAEVDAARSEALARYGGEQVEVCVAKRDIAAGEPVDASCVETRLWVADLLPAEAVRSVEEVGGKAASSAILAGEVLSMKRFQGAENQVEAPEGLAAVSVPAKDVQAVGGAVRAGARVDMYATGGTSTDLLASDVLVLATSASSGDEARDASVSWVTVAVEPDRVQEVVSAAQRTELYFALPGNEAVERTEGAQGREDAR